MNTNVWRSGACLCLALAVLLALGGSARAEKWALLIGIDKYADRNHISDLAGAANDAKQLRETLISKVGVPEDNIDLLISEGESKPSRFNIVGALDRLRNNVQKGDTVFVFFSGHGTQLAGKDYLLPYDFNGQSEFTGRETGLEEDKFYEQLSLVSARAIILIWDKCRNDPFSVKRSSGPRRNTMTESQANRTWRVVPNSGGPAGDDGHPILVKFFACAPGQCSYEWTDKGRGYFTYFLEEGLKGAATNPKGDITVKSLEDYLQKQVSQRVKRDLNASQTPWPRKEGPGADEFVLIPGKSATPDPNPDPNGSPRPPDPDGTAPDPDGMRGAKKLLPARLILHAPVDVEAYVDGQQIVGNIYEVMLPPGGKKTVQFKAVRPGFRPIEQEVELDTDSPVEFTLRGRAAPVSAAASSNAKTLVAEVLKAHQPLKLAASTSLFMRGSGELIDVDQSREKRGKLLLLVSPGNKFRIGFDGRGGKQVAGSPGDAFWYGVRGETKPGTKMQRIEAHPLSVYYWALARLADPTTAWSIQKTPGNRGVFGQGSGLTALLYADSSAEYLLLLDPNNQVRGVRARIIEANETIDVLLSIQSYASLKNGVPHPSQVRAEISTGDKKRTVSYRYGDFQLDYKIPPGAYDKADVRDE